MHILQGSNDPLLIIQLSINRQFTRVRSRIDPDYHLEPSWDGSEEFHPDAEADECCHGAVWDGRCEFYVDCGVFCWLGVCVIVIEIVMDVDMIAADNVQLLECEGMFGILNISYNIEYLPLGDCITLNNRIVGGMWVHLMIIVMIMIIVMYVQRIGGFEVIHATG